MTTRKEYVEQLKENFNQWNADISKWESRARMMQVDLRIDFRNRLEHLRKQREEMVAKLKALQASGEDAWKAGTNSAWATLRKTIDKVTSHFQK